jgi:disulfide bond formation protein DsbB
MLDTQTPEPAATATPRQTAADYLTVAALGAALVGSLGSLYLSIGMQLLACPLCFYQRSFILATFGVLGIGLLARPRGPVSVCLMALPLALAGLGVAIFHVYLEVSGKLECPPGILGLGTAPQQSLAVNVILAVLLALALAAGLARRVEPGAPAILGGAAILGVAFAVGCVLSSPPAAPRDPAKVGRMCQPARPPAEKL